MRGRHLLVVSQTANVVNVDSVLWRCGVGRLTLLGSGVIDNFLLSLSLSSFEVF